MSPKRALARLVLVFLEGRNYDSQNPYARPEVHGALRVLGVDDIEDVRDVAEGRKSRTHKRRG